MKNGVSRLDLRLGFRMLAKYPGLTVVGGLGMAVAIAIGAGFFAFLHSHLYPRIPLEEGERIIALENWDVQANNEERQAVHDFVAWRDGLKSVTDIAAFRDVQHNLITGEGPSDLVHVAEMTAAGFRVARVPPLLGRYLVEDDEREGAPRVVVIGHDVWQNRFQGDTAIVGRVVRFGTTAHTVVGVMPRGFAFPRDHRFWTPMRVDPAKYERGRGPELFIFGRLVPGFTIDDAQAELSAIGRRTAAAFPKTHERLRPQALPYTYPLLDIQDPGGMWQFTLMQVMVSLLLVVIALNVAVLVYARTATRRGEIAVRMALGASRRRIVAQLFVEALVLTAGAAAVGLPLAQFGLRQGNLIMEQEVGVPFWTDYGLRPATVLYVVGLAVLAAVIVGVLPGLQSTGRQLQADLRQLGGGTGMRLGKTWTALVVAQVAIAVAALPSAASMGWDFVRGAMTKPLFPAEQFLVAAVGLPESEVPTAADTAAHQREMVARFGAHLTELMRRVQAEPNVAGVTFTGSLPGRGGVVRVEVDGVPAPPESPSGHVIRSSGVGPGFLDIVGARVLAGRRFADADLRTDATAVIVNRTFVRKVLGGASALGKHVRYVPDAADETASADATTRGPWYEIVGVVEDLQSNALDPELVPANVYYPVSPEQVRGASLAVRMRGPTPLRFGQRLREITIGVDPTLRLGAVRSMADADRQAEVAARLVALAVGLIMVSVFLLSAAGAYALMSFAVAQRRREIGIRSALGAPRSQVLRSIFSRAAGQIAIGLVLGVSAAAVLERLSGGELMSGEAAILLPGVAVTMAIVGLLAALGPARRALGIQPTEALRADG